MKLNKTTLLFIATLLFLAIPVLFTGNAGAVTAVSGTYNSDAAVQSATSGQWNIPSSFYCVATPSGWTPSATLSPAVRRDDLAAPSSLPYNTACAIADTATKNAVKYSDYPTNTVKRTIDECVASGYAWSGYSGSCGASTWTTDDPDNSPLPYYTDHKGCLRCHNDAYISNSTHSADQWAKKESYLKGGHKNMVRKVTVPKPWGLPGTDATGIYALGVNGTTSDYKWTDGTIDVGSCSDATKKTKDVCVAPATWTPNWKTMLWMYGGNGLEGTTPTAIYANGNSSGKPKTSYSCARCHATGWTSDATINTNKEPEVSYPGVSWDGVLNSGVGSVNLAGGVSGDAKQIASWDRFGIQCSRCHEATGSPTASKEAGPYSGGHATFPIEGVNTGGDITAMCMNCHRQESSGVPDVVSGYKVAANSPADTLVIGASHGAPPVGFVSHSHGTQFLNSPHARMTGTWSQIGCPPVSISPAGTAGCDSTMSKYDSNFRH